MTAKPTDAERITEVIRPTLDAFTIAAEPHVRKVAESLYEHLLGMTQDYLRENAEWNLGEEVLRCRRTEIENINLRERIRVLEEALQPFTLLAWVGDLSDDHEFDAGFTVGDIRRARAALSREAQP